MKRTLGFIFGVVRLKIRGKDYTPINLINCRFGTAARHFQVLEGHRKHFSFSHIEGIPGISRRCKSRSESLPSWAGAIANKEGAEKTNKGRRNNPMGNRRFFAQNSPT
jgi:hypothetical protein